MTTTADRSTGATLATPRDAGRIFVDPTAYADPKLWHEAAALLRREDPVHLVEAEGFDPFYAVTRHADILEVERQHERFWNTLGAVLGTRAQQQRIESAGVQLKTLIHMDGEEHREHRRITNDWFKPGNLRRTLEAAVKTLSRRFVDRMLDLGGECDFARDVALYYPLHVVMSVLGVPEEDEPRMLELTQKLFGAEDPDFGGEDAQQSLLAALLDFAAYFNQMTADRRAHPASDLASTIANAAIGGEPLGDLQTISYYIIVATAGHDTTSSSLAGGLQGLLENPEQLERLRARPELLDNAVDEIIRWVSPVRHFMRYAQEDAALAGTKIRAGERVLLSYLSGNRDEQVFADPFRFDVERPNADQHVAFGTGVHFCLGAHLARMELRAFFSELLPRLDSIELAGAPEQTATTFVGGPKRVPIRYRLRPAQS